MQIIFGQIRLKTHFSAFLSPIFSPRRVAMLRRHGYIIRP